MSSDWCRTSPASIYPHPWNNWHAPHKSSCEHSLYRKCSTAPEHLVSGIFRKHLIYKIGPFTNEDGVKHPAQVPKLEGSRGGLPSDQDELTAVSMAATAQADTVGPSRPTTRVGHSVHCSFQRERQHTSFSHLGLVRLRSLCCQSISFAEVSYSRTLTYLQSSLCSMYYDCCAPGQDMPKRCIL